MLLLSLPVKSYQFFLLLPTYKMFNYFSVNNVSTFCISSKSSTREHHFKHEKLSCILLALPPKPNLNGLLIQLFFRYFDLL